MNMFLISIETREKSKQINELVMKNVVRNFVWIGGYALPNSDPLKFLWVRSGKILNYTHWESYNPRMGNGDCIQSGFSDMIWFNYNCENKVGFICESLPPSPIIENNEIKEVEKKLQDQKISKNLLKS